MTTCVFMPAYNAGAHLADVLGRIPAHVWPLIDCVVIVDDGSTDDTAHKAGLLRSRFDKIDVVSLPENRGYGEAVKTGLARCRDANAACSVCLHADGQYPPEYLSRMIERIEQGCDLVQASRIAGGGARQGGMPQYKYVAGRILTWMENRVFGLHLTDYHSGYLAYSARALRTIAFDRLSTSFDFDLEMIASARAHELRITEVPIPTRYADEISYLNPVGYGLRVLLVMAKYLRGHYRGTSSTS